MTALSSPASKRLLHELQAYAQEPNPALLHLGPVDDEQLLHWRAVLKGIDGTPYEGGLWELDIRISESYPMAPPDVRFLTRICHPNVNFKTGEICLDLLKSAWTPAYSIAATLNAIHMLLTDPGVDSPLNVDIAALLRQGDAVGGESLVRYYTAEERWTG